MEMQQMIDGAMLDAPIPGESLAHSPDTPRQWETPPDHVNYEEAQEFLFDQLMENSTEIIEMISQGAPVTWIALQAAMAGFVKGRWNTDLMLLLLEPAIYIVLFICEQAGIDYVFDWDEEEMTEPEAIMKADNYMQQAMKQTSGNVQAKMEEGGLEDAMPPSLLSKVGETV